MEFKLKALTDIWTGGVERNDNSILHLTNVKGSIRWWYEVLIRGLDGYACDPTSKTKNEKCEFDTKSFQKHRKLEVELGKICPACQMFGCTGWSGKFNLRIKNDAGDIVTKKSQMSGEGENLFTFEFVNKKELKRAEKLLLEMTLKLIVDYGAIGGKTVLKPSGKDYKNTVSYGGGRHRDYGIIDRRKDDKETDTPRISSEKIYDGDSKKEIDNHIKAFVAKSHSDNQSDWPDLENFWFVKGAYIERLEHNSIVSRYARNPKYYNDRSASEFNVFTGGYITENREKVIPNGLKRVVKNRDTKSDNESKKIFSFHGLSSDARSQAFTPRCFGYARNDAEREEVAKKVVNILNNKRCKYEFKTGREVLDGL